MKVHAATFKKTGFTFSVLLHCGLIGCMCVESIRFAFL